MLYVGCPPSVGHVRTNYIWYGCINTDKIKNKSSEKFTKLVNISDTKKSSQADLNKDFIKFKKSQNIASHDDTDHE